VDKTIKTVLSTDRFRPMGLVRIWRCVVRYGCGEVESAVGSLEVVVADVLGEDPLEGECPPEWWGLG
jgi:hypothetical protein